MSSVKSRNPIHGRASALTVQGFFLDVVGYTMYNNAVAWDVHCALHTRCAPGADAEEIEPGTPGSAAVGALRRKSPGSMRGVRLP